MKKILIFILIFLSGIYLLNAVDIGLNSGEKLENLTWQNLSGILNKVNTNNNNAKISGNLMISGRLCNTSGKCLDDNGSIANPGISCSDILENSGSYGNGIYRLDVNGGSNSDAFQAYCDMTNYGGGWTLVYKNADTTGLKTTGELNKSNLLSSDISLATIGKLSDEVIKQLYTQQFMAVQYGSSLGPNFCKFADINNYADNAINMKYCSQTYSSSANYSSLSYTGNEGRYKGFSSRGTAGFIITELNQTDSRKGSHIQYGSTTSDSGCSASGGCHTQVWVK